MYFREYRCHYKTLTKNYYSDFSITPVIFFKGDKVKISYDTSSNKNFKVNKLFTKEPRRYRNNVST